MRINYNHLRYFWFVAHQGHLTRAAEQLHLSQSALSAQIKTLEEQLGYQLFERRGRRLELTETGHLVLEYADTIFRSGEEMLAQLAQGRLESQRVFRVGAIPTLSRNFQIQFLKPLFGLENLDVVVTSASIPELLSQLEAHRLDVALTNHVPVRDAATHWVSHRISEQPVSLVGDPDLVRPRRALKSLLREEPLVVPSMDSTIRTGFEALMERLELRPRIVAEVNDMTMLRLIAREKIGLAVVPPIVVKDELENGELREWHKLPDLTESFYAVTLKRKFPNPLLKEVIPQSQADGDPT